MSDILPELSPKLCPHVLNPVFSTSALPHGQHRLLQQPLCTLLRILSQPEEGPQMLSRTRANRRRHTQACIPCQSSKRRCSSGLPCSHCIRRNCESSCVYNRDRRKRQPQAPSLAISEHESVLARESELPSLPQKHLQTRSQSQTWPGPQSSFPTPSTPDEAVDLAQAAPDSNVPGETPEDHVFLQPRILKDSSGNDGMDRHMDPCSRFDRGNPTL